MRIPVISWLLLIPLLAALFGVDPVLVSGQCLRDQRSFLLQLKNSLNFSSQISVRLVNWTQSNDCCVWKGVACDRAGRVTGLDLNSESISGGLEKSSLFSLQFLESLNLANNSFSSATIPSRVGNLTNLVSLNLSNAGFAGQIPIGLSFLKRLIVLDLSTHMTFSTSLQLENPNLSRLFQNLAELTELHLDGVNISAGGRDWCQAISSSLPNLRVLSLYNCNISGPIDSSLQKLRFLSEINLGSNNLSAPVPGFFSNFTNLTALILSSSNLYGTFPENIFMVPTLRTLRLDNNRLLNGFLPEYPPNGLMLRNLVLSNTKFSGQLPESIGNLRMLSRMELPGCNFSGQIPYSIENLTRLVYLDLSTNKFTGPIPSFRLFKNITHIDLSHNDITGPVPATHFEGLRYLVSIDLACNSFNGRIPPSLFSLPSLQKILLSNNQFGGQVIGFSNESLPPLDTLDLSSNKLQGPIPTILFDLRKLNVLSLSFNNFSGTIQLEWIQKLQNLTTFELSYNSLSVTVRDGNSSLSSFPKLSVLRLASCKLQKLPPLMNQSRMTYLDLSANQISGEIPHWIWNTGNGTLTYLNLSCNILVDLQRPYLIPSSLSVLDLHSNQLHGEIPVPPVSIIYVDYSSNSFSSSIPVEVGYSISFAIFFSLSNNSLFGVIPQTICNATNLQVLDLSNNKFTGFIPDCLIESCTETLGVLNLRNNRLTGNISAKFPKVCALKTLDLNGNNLEGQVPSSLANCANLEVLNLGNNKINDTFSCFLKNLTSLRVLNLRSNRFNGGIRCGGHHNNSWSKLQIIDLALNNFSGSLPEQCLLSWKAMMVDEGNALSDANHLKFEFLNLNHFYYQDTVTITFKGLEMELVKILTVFTAIDLSDNSFQGEIPATVGALASLYVLNLSHNALTSQIPSSIGNMTQLGSLDLSRNRLSGRIPVELASLTFLSVLNLSYNHLVGMIPKGTQLQSFPAFSFEGNNGLCGAPLNRTCGSSPIPSSNDSVTVLSREFDWQFICTGLGFGIGAGFVIGPLMFWKRASNWCNARIEKFAWMLLPILSFIFTCCNVVKVKPEAKTDEVLFDETGDSDEDEDEEGKEGEVFPGRYCVFCSKLDIQRKKVIHYPKCSCHELPSICCSSSSSSSSYPQ